MNDKLYKVWYYVYSITSLRIQTCLENYASQNFLDYSKLQLLSSIYNSNMLGLFETTFILMNDEEADEAFGFIKHKTSDNILRDLINE